MRSTESAKDTHEIGVGTRLMQPQGFSVWIIAWPAPQVSAPQGLPLQGASGAFPNIAFSGSLPQFGQTAGFMGLPPGNFGRQQPTATSSMAEIDQWLNQSMSGMWSQLSLATPGFSADLAINWQQLAQQMNQQVPMGSVPAYPNPYPQTGQTGRIQHSHPAGSSSSRSSGSYRFTYPEHIKSQPSTTYTGTPSTGGRQNVVAWASSQIGVNETDNPGIVKAYSRGAWQSWCADFVSTALERNGGSPWGHISSVSGIYEWAAKNKRLTNTPKPGDAILLTSNGKRFGHTGIVESVTKEGVWTIEGNTRNAVRRVFHRFSDSRVRGFVRT